jgi:hypothetical protein
MSSITILSEASGGVFRLGPGSGAVFELDHSVFGKKDNSIHCAAAIWPASDCAFKKQNATLPSQGWSQEFMLSSWQKLSALPSD